MLTTKDIERASELITLRKLIAEAKWNCVCRREFTWGRSVEDAEEFDDTLALAVEEYRGRRLDKIDAELRELGVDPTQADEEERQDDGIFRVHAKQV